MTRLYRDLFRDTKLNGSMDTFIADLSLARNRLEKGDTDTKVSDGIMGYLTLTRCSLDEAEVKHVLRLTNGDMKLSVIKKHLIQLYPSGSYRKRRHHAHVAEEADEEGYYDAGEDEGEAYCEKMPDYKHQRRG